MALHRGTSRNWLLKRGCNTALAVNALIHLHLYSQCRSSICRVHLYVANVPAALEYNQTQRITRWTDTTAKVSTCVIWTEVSVLVRRLLCAVPWAALLALISCCLGSKCLSPRCQSHCRFLSCCSGTSTRLQEMLFSLNSTLGHLVDCGRGPLGSGLLTGAPTVATAW